MATSALPVIPSLNNSYGSIYIGMVVAAGLWGIGTAQVYWYFTTYSKDPFSIKLLVSTVWGLDTIHQALISYLIYFYVITNYFNPLALDFEIWAFSVQSLFELLPCFIVQSFFLMRIWRLSNGKLYLLVLPGLFVLGKLVLGIVWIALCFRTTSITEADARFHTISESINGLAAGADILLGVTMVGLLYLARTGFSQSDTLLTKLMIYGISTGAITSVWSIITLITATRLPGTYIFGAFYFCIGRLYLNTMLASLNARKNLKDKMLEMNSYHSGGTTRTLPVEDSNRKNADDRFPRFKSPEAWNGSSPNLAV